MNILFFLKPKAEVAFVYDYHTLRQAMEIMEYHKYSSIPMINREGKYVGTITEGDLLWGLKKLNILNLKEAEDIAAVGAVPADAFIWHAVTRAVGNVKNQGPELIEAAR